MEYGKNMMLYSSYWQSNNGNYDNTFKMMPVKLDCPFSEAIYDTNSAMLVVLSKDKVEKMQMVPMLNGLGDVMYTNARKGKPYKEQRIKINLCNEFVIHKKDEIIDFINTFCVNSADYNYQDILDFALQKKQDELNKTIDNLNEIKNGKNKISKACLSKNGHGNKSNDGDSTK